MEITSRLRSAVRIAYGLTLAALLTAQDVTSPAGYLTQEAPGRRAMFAILPSVSQIVQIDRSLIGTPRPGIHTLSWRRDGTTLTRWLYASQTVDVEVRLAHCDWSQLQPGSENDLDLLRVDPFVVAFSRKPVVLPDWREVPVAAPAAFDLQLTLDTPWSYDGVHSLLWQMKLGANAIGTSYYTDGLDESIALPALALGTGCRFRTAYPPMQLPMALESHLRLESGAARWALQVLQLPEGHAVALTFGLSDPDLDVGACTRMRSSHDIVEWTVSIPPGMVLRTYDLVHQPSLVGAQVYVQAVAVDPTQPLGGFSFTQGIRQEYPAPLVPLGEVALGYASAGQFDPNAWDWRDRMPLETSVGIVTGIDGL